MLANACLSLRSSYLDDLTQKPYGKLNVTYMNCALSSNNNSHLKQLCNTLTIKVIITINALNNSILAIKLSRLSLLRMFFPKISSSEP